MPIKATKQREVLRLLLLGLQIADIAKELTMTTKKVYKARGELARKGFLTKTEEGIYIESTGQQEGGNTSLIIPTRGELFPLSRNNWIRYHNIQVTVGILKAPDNWLSQQNSIFFRNADKNFGLTKYIDLTKEEITGRIYRKTIVIQLPEITKPTKDRDVQNLAARFMAIEILRDSWKELEKYKNDEQNKSSSSIKQVGL